LRTERVVVRTSSTDKFKVISRDYIRFYSMPKAAKVAHIKAHPRVSLNLDSDGKGTGIVAVGGEARIDAVDADPTADEQYQAKYAEYAASTGMSQEFLAGFSTRLKVAIDKVRTTPTGG